MPRPRPGEKRNSFVSRAIKAIMAEGGHTQEQAVGKAEGMFEFYSKKRKKRGIRRMLSK
jgi:hypothetical protein